MSAMIRDFELLPQDATQYCPAGQLSTPLLSQAHQQELLARLRERFFAPWKDAGQPAVTVANTSLRKEPTLAPQYSDPATPGGGPPFDQLQVTTLWPGTPLTILHVAGDWAHVGSPLGDGWMPQADLATADAAFVAQWMHAPLAGITEDNISVTPGGTPKSAWGCPDPKTPPRVPIRAGLGGATQNRITQDGTTPGAMLPSAEACRATTNGEDMLPQTEAWHPSVVLGIGAILPMAEATDSEIHLLVPVSNSGLAEFASVAAPFSHAGLLPMPMTVANLARLANRMLGQPYGWGGLGPDGQGGLRDCSSTTHDLLAPFGLWLPRNSCEQATAGRAIPLTGMSNADKERTILKQGKPWLTLLRSPGHIMLYIGSRDGHAVMLHNFWAVRTVSFEHGQATQVGSSATLACGSRLNENARESRHVVARCCITTLAPGAELPDLLPGGTYLNMMESMVILP